MTDQTTDNGVSRAQFLRNTAKGGIALAVGGSVLASVQGAAMAAGVSDNSTLQAAYCAESLAVYVYEGVLASFNKFKHPELMNIDYFQHALDNEKAHKAFLANALGSSKTPTGLTLKIPASALKSGQAVLNFGVALETAFVATYLGAVSTLSSNDLKLVAAQVAADEATHFSFFDAAAGGHGVLPSLPATVTIAQAATTLTPYIPNLMARLTAAGFPNA